jgi:hypothetical protein
MLLSMAKLEQLAQFLAIQTLAVSSAFTTTANDQTLIILT